MSENIAFYISDIARLMRKRFDIAARALGVTGPQWRTMYHVNRNPGINQGSLAELLEVEPITICRMVDRMEQANLLERRRDPHDRRAWQLYLTDPAKHRMEELQQLGLLVIDEALGDMSDANRALLIQLLDRVRDNLVSTLAADPIAGPPLDKINRHG